jgi:signal transduction histidine kinase
MTSRISRGIAITLMIALMGGTFLIIQAAAHLISGLPVVAALLATAVVALLFLPLWESIEQLVNRFVGGSRPTAYHVLADLTTLSRATSADTSNLTGVAEAIAVRLGARSCRLTVIHPGLRDRSYAWPASVTATADDDVVLPICQGTEQIGTIAVNRAAGTGMQRRQLLEDIANSLGAIVAVSRLGIELERQLRAAVAHAEEIAHARRQAVAEMDNERRRMERNLHDGAQHHLVSLRLTLGLVEHGVTSGQLDAAIEGLGRLITQISSAEAILAETAATGASSSLLTERGLIAALRADLSSTHPPISVTSPETLVGRRFSPEIEAAVYFCCLEAVNNARKHAPGATVSVRLGELDGSLHFTVRDNGPGFVSEPGRGGTVGPPGGRGMRNVRARITAVGGIISVRSAPGAGTTVEGAVPLPRRQNVLDQTRELIRDARQLYDGSAQSERLRDLQAQLDKPLAAQKGGAAGASQASPVLRALDALMRSSPLDGERAIKLRYQVEQIRSGTHELTEIDLLEELRSGSLPLSTDERRVAEQLLGADGAEPRARLGLRPDADTAEVRQIAGQQRERWQRRASHPASTRAVRDAAEVLTLTCEQLLTQISTE